LAESAPGGQERTVDEGRTWKHAEIQQLKEALQAPGWKNVELGDR
jgi:hypothetical protein